MAAALPPLKFGMPPIGIGTYELRGDDCVHAVRSALQLGYRLIDTAAVYRNEELVGEGIATSGVPRAELFVVVKIAMKSMGSDEAVRNGILESIRKLRIQYADCVLMHWPGCGGLKPEDAAGHHAARARCWRVMQELQRCGAVRYMGVSNFLPRHFNQLHCFDSGESLSVSSHPTCVQNSEESHGTTSPLNQCYNLPIVNQVELHPLCVQQDVDAYCRGAHGMILQQYSPLGKGDARLLQHPKLLEVHERYFQDSTTSSATAAPSTAAAHKKPKREAEDGDEVKNDTSSHAYSVHDLVLMWGLAQGYCTLVRSHKVEHLKANLAAATDYFASLQQSTEVGECGRRRPPLSAEQLEVVKNLRRHMGVEGAEDLHLCWYSSTIA